VDPLLAGNHRLRPGSPSIDSGTNTAPGLPATDLDGDARILNDTVDMGADEFKARARVPCGLLLLREPVGIPDFSVIPAKAGVQTCLKRLDSGSSPE